MAHLCSAPPVSLSPPAAPPCPDPAILRLKCSPVTCEMAGVVVPLADTCTSSISGANYIFTVDGEPADSVTCPMPGYGVHVEPSIDSCYGIPACTYGEQRMLRASGGAWG